MDYLFLIFTFIVVVCVAIIMYDLALASMVVGLITSFLIICLATYKMAARHGILEGAEGSSSGTATSGPETAKSTPPDYEEELAAIRTESGGQEGGGGETGAGVAGGPRNSDSAAIGHFAGSTENAAEYGAQPAGSDSDDEPITDWPLYERGYVGHQLFSPPPVLDFASLGASAHSVDSANVRMAKLRTRDERQMESIASRTSDYYKYFFADELNRAESQEWWGANDY